MKLFIMPEWSKKSMMEELISRIPNKKKLKQSLRENLDNTRQCEEKLLRNCIALEKKMVEKSEVEKVYWVETKGMLADTLTKIAGNGSWVKDVVERNRTYDN